MSRKSLLFNVGDKVITIPERPDDATCQGSGWGFGITGKIIRIDEIVVLIECIRTVLDSRNHTISHSHQQYIFTSNLKHLSTNLKPRKKIGFAKFVSKLS